MDPNLQKALLDRVYEKRKAATLELEKQTREALAKNDRARINLIVQQLCSFLTSPTTAIPNPQNANARNGGLIGLAGVGIALGAEIATYLEEIVPPVLTCFADSDSKIRYFACESFYNITKVCKGEILIYFNEIFDALSKLAADTELSVKNGAELLDRLLKDIVCEAAPHYVSLYQDIPRIRARQDASEGNAGGKAELDIAREKTHVEPVETLQGNQTGTGLNKAFSLARFVPLLAERIYVISPFTRNFLVSWITVLDSIPDLELVTYLPRFLDGLLKYLSDPNTDVRIATSNVLADFLREIQDAAEVARLRKEEQARAGKKESAAVQGDGSSADTTVQSNALEEEWIPAKEIRIDHVSIIEILLSHITFPDEEIQATTQQWISELLIVVKEVVLPFTPRILPAILPNIAHHSPAIQSAANALNVQLYQVIEGLDWQKKRSSRENVGASDGSKAGSLDLFSSERRNVLSPPTSPRLKAIAESSMKRKVDLKSRTSMETEKERVHEAPFDLQSTVTVLTLQLINEHEETRISSLEWLLLLHSKAPRRILNIDDGTFPALLKTLSDPSEDVIRCDLRLLAQMSSASDDAYNSYLANLVNLFSTDRHLLEARGSLIVRQLCTTLHTERVFRTLADVLEFDEDLEFASIMVTNLNMILITSPELSDFRKRLKNLETKDGQDLFVSLYRSWCHNAVATLSLCLLAQAYEHASNLLSIFPDLEITVPFLIQIDKLVQLIESPVFMTLRLQLLEPERYPHLLKTLYGLLMLLPQSSAFATLRNRLNAVSALGYLQSSSSYRSSLTQQSIPASLLPAGQSGSTSASQASNATNNVGATRSKIVGSNRDDLRWNELLTHFKLVQARHERARKAAASSSSNGATFSVTMDNSMDHLHFAGLSSRASDGHGTFRPLKSRKSGTATTTISGLRSLSGASSTKVRQSTPIEPTSSLARGGRMDSSATTVRTSSASRPNSPASARRSANNIASEGNTSEVSSLLARTLNLQDSNAAALQKRTDDG